jgi:aminoglycoside phosphotransferase family enzyme/predicted kinase
MAPDPDINAKAGPQADVIAFLSDPASFPGADTVKRIDTHAAIVFLAGPAAYKIKRAVKYPFLDFSTLERRRLACEHEIEVNRANAPQIYLGAVPLTRRPDGSLEIAGDGEIVEWTVHMNRFDETRTLDRVIGAGPLPDNLIDALAHQMAQAHARAPVQDAGPWIADLRNYVDQNAEAFSQYPDLFPSGQADDLSAASIAAFDRIRPLLEARGLAGHVRLCHGDAHLGNIVLIGEQPVLFDAIEFDDVIATADVLYDLAFLLMDLCERGHLHEANRTLNRYLVESRSPDHNDGLAALPFFLMMRAAIRAKVTASRLEFSAAAACPDLAAQVGAYFSAARGFLSPKAPRLIAVGGLSGTGKSTLAAGIAAGIGRAPGAVVLRSDIMRKQLAGVGETDRLPADAYSLAASDAVYEEIYRTAARILATGHSVIADAVFARQGEREAIAETGRSAGIPFTGLWLDAPLHVLTARVGARTGDASDADEDVVRRQMEYDLGEMTWQTIDASGPSDRAIAEARHRLGIDQSS